MLVVTGLDVKRGCQLVLWRSVNIRGYACFPLVVRVVIRCCCLWFTGVCLSLLLSSENRLTVVVIMLLLPLMMIMIMKVMENDKQVQSVSWRPGIPDIILH